MTRIAVISDMHCGHKAGLTPPAFRSSGWWGRYQAEAWDWYKREVRRNSKPDILIVLGDAIDGSGKKSGGTEQITTDRVEQGDIANECIALWGAKKHHFVYGTGYHTGSEEDFEVPIARHFNAKIGSHEWLDCGGVVFDLKHHLGSSSIPHGRYTALAKEKMWNELWKGEQPQSDILLRAHVHYFAYCGGRNERGDWLACSLPALQRARTKYGSRRCSGKVDFGFLTFEIGRNRSWSWESHIADLRGARKVRV